MGVQVSMPSKDAPSRSFRLRRPWLIHRPCRRRPDTRRCRLEMFRAVEGDAATAAATT